MAKNAFNFKATDFVDLIQNYIVAMEISHNNGLEDEHLPILEEGWYWSIIKDQRFSECFKILEFRNTSIEDILKNIKMIDNRFGV